MLQTLKFLFALACWTGGYAASSYANSFRPLEATHVKVEHVLELYRRANQFAPQQELLETYRWEATQRVNQNLFIRTSQLAPESPLHCFSKIEFDFFNWRYFVSERKAYKPAELNNSKHLSRQFFKGGSNTRYTSVIIDHDQQLAFYRIGKDILVKESYASSPQNLLLPYEQVMRWKFREDSQTYNVVWKVKIDGFGFYPKNIEVLRQAYPDYELLQAWQQKSVDKPAQAIEAR